jgi:hypothetical protein
MRETNDKGPAPGFPIRAKLPLKTQGFVAEELSALCESYRYFLLNWFPCRYIVVRFSNKNRIWILVRFALKF